MSEPNVAPDTEKFVDSLDMGQVLFIINLFNFGSGALSELLAYCSDRWNAQSNTTRKKVAHETTDRFFSEKAFEEYEKANARYRVIKEREEAQRNKSNGGNGHEGHPRRILIPGRDF